MNRSNDNQFSISIAYQIARLSENSYLDSEEFSKAAKYLGFEVIKTVFSDETDTEGYWVTNHKINVLVFRGTEVEPNLLDILSDIDLQLVPTGNHKFHRGFLRCFDSVNDQVRLLPEAEPRLPRYLGGHSLGGALAKVAYLRAPEMNWAGCYTFGAPAVGEIKAHEGVNDRIYRINNYLDPVPYLVFLAPKSAELATQLLDPKLFSQLIPYFKAAKDPGGIYNHIGVHYHLVDDSFLEFKSAINLMLENLAKCPVKIFDIFGFHSSRAYSDRLELQTHKKDHHFSLGDNTFQKRSLEQALRFEFGKAPTDAPQIPKVSVEPESPNN